MYQCYLVASGSGQMFYFGIPCNTVEECSAEVLHLDEGYKRWELAGFPTLPPDSPMAHYEGCDIYAEHTDGRVLELDGENYGERDYILAWY